MRICASCGGESPDGFRHCGHCGASLAEPVAERRKLATLVFCDLSGSTAMGERVDAETVRSLMLSYFQEMRAALERHGGTVEKFVGDAVLAVFGVPEAHEDDALRACRAALEMQARLAALNEGFAERYGTRIALRIGVNTGEVVAGDSSSRETFVTGDPVNVAARLEQAAGPGEVLLGERTYRLVRDSVQVEAVEPLSAKGKSEPVPAYRLLAAGGPVSARPTGTAFTGREAELALLERELAAVVDENRCRLVTIIGEPGVGKSRLTAEFVARAGARARVVRGKCLSYGEGITYWPIGEIVRELAGVDDDHSPAEARAQIEAHVEGIANGAVVASNLAQLLGLDPDGAASLEDPEWAIRHFLIAQADREPLVVVVDDVHWGEGALHDLLETLPATIADAPLLLLCLGRTELLERRPGWEVTARLEPLGAGDVDALLESLIGDAPPAARQRLARACAGNPLFAEELVAMLADEGVLAVEGGVASLSGDLDALALPASLHALLGARLDRLEPDALAAIERAAIEGELFHRGAVVELSAPDSRAAVPAVLQTLAGRDLVRPAEPSFVEEAAFSFKHILVREAAYAATAKKLRASLHEQFAGWLERAAGERATEYEEIIGHHLEQAFRYRAELGPLGEHEQALGERAARRLAAAGHRAVSRGDLAGAVNLLGRAAALLPPESLERAGVVLDLVEPLAGFGRVAEAEALIDDALAAAGRLGDERLAARLDMGRTWLAVSAQAGSMAETDALARVERAMSVFERHADDVGLARAYEVAGMVHYYYGRLAEASAAAEHGFRHAERADDQQEQGNHRLVRTATAQWGFTPLDRVQALLEDDLAWARRTGSLGVEAKTTLRSSVVHAVRGDAAAGDELFARGFAACSDLGLEVWAAGFVGLWIFGLTDDLALAERRLRESWDVLAAAGRRGVLSTTATILADCLYRQGRYDEIDEALAFAAEAGENDDLITQVRLRAGRATLLAQRGESAAAEALARDAVALGETMEYVDVRGDSLLALAEVQRLAGRTGDAATTLGEAVALWDAKGNVAWAGRARSLLAGL